MAALTSILPAPPRTRFFPLPVTVAPSIVSKPELSLVHDWFAPNTILLLIVCPLAADPLSTTMPVPAAALIVSVLPLMLVELPDAWPAPRKVRLLIVVSTPRDVLRLPAVFAVKNMSALLS